VSIEYFSDHIKISSFFEPMKKSKTKNNNKREREKKKRRIFHLFIIVLLGINFFVSFYIIIVYMFK
jgi:cell division septal protein FtsQ